MVYGDGDGDVFSPLGAALDVVAHELTHGVTDFTSDLIYFNESGALNEGLSDIFSAAAEAWIDGGINDDTWKLGEDIYTRTPPVMRCATWTTRLQTVSRTTTTPSATPALPTTAACT